MASGSSVCLDIRESISSYVGMQRSERKRRCSKDNWRESERIVKVFYTKMKKMRRL